MQIKFKLGVITDEVTQDIFEAARFCQKHGLKCMEVRSVNGRSPFDYTDEDVEQIIAAAKEYNRNLEFLLKDLSTVGHNPACLWRWQEIVMEELMK